MNKRTFFHFEVFLANDQLELTEQTEKGASPLNNKTAWMCDISGLPVKKESEAAVGFLCLATALVGHVWKANLFMQRLKSCAAAWVIESFYTTYTYIKVKSYIPSSAFSHKKVGKRGKYKKRFKWLAAWRLGFLVD